MWHPRKLYGFSVNVDRSDVRLEGTVSHQFSLRPQRGNQYEEFTRVNCRSRARGV